MGNAICCHPIHCLFHLLKYLQKFFVSYLNIIDPDPLIYHDQMRRSKKPVLFFIARRIACIYAHTDPFPFVPAT